MNIAVHPTMAGFKKHRIIEKIVTRHLKIQRNTLIQLSLSKSSISMNLNKKRITPNNINLVLILDIGNQSTI